MLGYCEAYQNINDVSILVFVELVLDGPDSLQECLGDIVSILVFVELVLDEGYRRRLDIVRKRGFNPCFRGTCS